MSDAQISSPQTAAPKHTRRFVKTTDALFGYTIVDCADGKVKLLARESQAIIELIQEIVAYIRIYV